MDNKTFTETVVQNCFSKTKFLSTEAALLDFALFSKLFFILASQEVVLKNQCTLFYRHLKIVIFAEACKIPRSEWANGYFPSLSQKYY